MEWLDFLQLVKIGNTPQQKFFGTVSLHDELGPSLVAMSNTKGGRIIIGFDIKNIHLVGTNLDKEWIDVLISQYCMPSPGVSVTCFEKNDKRVMLVTIISHNKKPYYYKNNCYVMDEKTKLSLLEKDTQHSFSEEDESINTTSTLDTLTDSVKKTDTLSCNDTGDIQKITEELLSLTNDIPTGHPTVLDKETQENGVKKKIINTPLSFKHSSSTQPLKTLNHRQEQALHYLTEHTEIKNKIYRNLFNVSHKTAHIELVDLVNKKRIQSQGSGRSTCYVLNQSIPDAVLSSEGIS